MKTKILLFFTTVLFLTGCQSNDNLDINITNADLIGAWNLTSQTIENGEMSITSSGTTLSITYSAEAKDIDMLYTFSENPNSLLLEGSYKFLTTATFLGETEVEEQLIDTSNDPIDATSWVLNSNNTITITDSTTSLPTILTIEDFSTNYIKLKGVIDESESDSGDSITIKATIYMTLEK
jgi:hypothetical protein